MVKDVGKVIHGQKQRQALAEGRKTHPKELQANQKDVGKKTIAIAKAIEKFTKGGAGAEKDLKSEPKDGGKGEGAKGEAKDSGAKGDEVAKGEAKDAGKDSQGPKGEAKGGDKSADTAGQPSEKQGREQTASQPKAG